jgi:hypothetical protein
MRRGALISVLALAASWAAPAAAFDSRDPTAILSVLTANGASGEIKKDDGGAPYIDAKAGQLKFTVDFYSCNTPKTLCDSVVYQVGWSDVKANTDQINRWNRWVLFCPAYLAKEDHPHAWFPVKGFADDTREHVKVQQDEWLSCLSDFDRFTDDPEAFLKAHG